MRTTTMEWDERYDLHLRTSVHTFSTERHLVDDPAVQKLLDEEQLVTWLLALGPWDVIAHLTWRDRKVTERDGTPKFLGISETSAARGVERFMDGLPGVSYFYSVEKNPSRDGHHAHMLWGDCHEVYRKEQWAKWLKLHGRARIEPVRSDKDVAGYASKYVMKLPCWWNVKLRWHRHQKLLNRKFELGSLEPRQVGVELPRSTVELPLPSPSPVISTGTWLNRGAGIWEPLR